MHTHLLPPFLHADPIPACPPCDQVSAIALLVAASGQSTYVHDESTYRVCMEDMLHQCMLHQRDSLLIHGSSQPTPSFVSPLAFATLRRVPFVITIIDGYNTGVQSTTHVLGPGRSTSVTGDTVTLLVSLSCTTQPPVTARPPDHDVCSLQRICDVFHLSQICYLGLLPPTGTQQALRADWGIFECFFTVSGDVLAHLQVA
jgi:hypothetical protein